MTLDTLFGTTAHITWLQESGRAALIFVYGLVVVRVAGRRVFAQWTPLDIIVAIVMGSTLSRALTGNANLFGTLAATTLLMVLHWSLSQAAVRWPALSRILEGRSVLLARDGQLDRSVLLRHAVSEGAIEEALRRAGLETPRDARLIVLEPSGTINIVK